MIQPTQSTLENLVAVYCEAANRNRVDANGKERWAEVLPATILERLKKQHAECDPDGWMLLECHMMDSARLGERILLPYGPNNTFKHPADHPVSPRGLASDMAVVEMVAVNPFRVPAEAGV